MKRRTFIGAALGAIGVSGAAAWQAGGRLHTGAALAFGTTINIAVVHADDNLARRAIDAGLAAAQRVERLMSIYHPHSQVFRLNKYGVLDQPDPHLLAVLVQASELSRLTGGAFDITVQPLWHAYSAAAASHRLPTAQQLEHAQSLVGWRDVAIHERGVQLLRPGMQITLNGLAQGYAADLALAAVQQHGICHALLDTGEFAGRGRKRAHQPWMLGVRDPRDAAALAATLYVNGCGVATSGDYESTFTPDYRHHHIFDPVQGDSPEELASVTVMAPSSMLADGLSTAFMVMGREKSAALAASLPAVDLLTVDKRGREWSSPEFALA